MSRAALVFLIVGVVSSAAAEPATPPQIPMDRVIANLTRRVSEAPTDAQAQYNLGRVHALALVCDGTKLSGWGDAPAACEGDYGPPGRRIGKHAEHLSPALEHLEEAVRLQPTIAAYHLGLAYALEAGSALDPKRAPLPRAVTEYRRAFDLAIATDGKTTHRDPIFGLSSLVSHEAGNAFLSLAAKLGAPKGKEVAEVEKKLAALEKIPLGAITPIVFSLSRAGSLGELLDGHATVDFDLDGTGRPMRWPWVKQDTALLVWDPGQRGHITSGWQLFGSVTFFLFWQDGYHALSVLDDDGDGELRGDELRGLAVWQDRNGDGRSDPSEVRSVELAGIVALKVRADGERDGVPFQAHGLTLSSGRQLPTYDWTPSPERLRGAPARRPISLF